jgi:hypothetical protein
MILHRTMKRAEPINRQGRNTSPEEIQ